MFNFEIYPVKPFMITPHLERFCLEDIPTPSLCGDGFRSCRRIICLDSECIPYKVLIVSEGDDPEIDVKVFTDDSNEAMNILGIIKEIYRVDFEYNSFIECVREIPVLYRLALKYRGLRPTRMVDMYEALLDSIIEQNISLALAMRIKGNFIRRYGVKTVIDGEEYYSFPSYEKIMKLDPYELKNNIKTTLRKAEAMIEVARNYDNIPSIDEIERKPEEFRDFITGIKGIGRWTYEISVAKVSKGFEMGPVTDLAVRRGFKRLLGVEDEDGIENIIGKIRRYAGLILYLMALEGHGK